jgi:hypothetical protein
VACVGFVIVVIVIAVAVMIDRDASVVGAADTRELPLATRLCL